MLIIWKTFNEAIEFTAFEVHFSVSENDEVTATIIGEDDFVAFVTETEEQNVYTDVISAFVKETIMLQDIATVTLLTCRNRDGETEAIVQIMLYDTAAVVDIQ